MTEPQSTATPAPDATPIVIRVLILEDLPSDAELMVRELKRSGFAPEWQRVETESEYLAHLDARPDVILADYRLPQFDALGALYDLHESGLDIPFIIVSGVISEEVAVSCMKQGAADYLLKDRMARLGPAVKRALEEQARRAEKERAEHALRESEERFRSLVDGVKDYAIIMLDPEGLIESWNPGAQRIHGWAAAEILGTPYSRFFIDGDDARGKQAYALEMAATSGRYEEQGWRRRKDGERFWADILITPLHDRTGALRGFSKLTRDITDRKQSEEAMARQAIELVRSNAELELFAHVASHDLKEPLTEIEEAGRVLASRAKVPGDAAESVAALLAATTRMRALIDDLHAFSESHVQGNVFVGTDMSTAYDTAVALLRAEIGDTGAAVTRDALPVVTADPTQMALLLQNLILNGLRHRGAEPPRIHVGARERPGGWEFTVADCGSEISAGDAERMFGLFAHGDSPGGNPGRGIGLAICRNIVERYGGTIRVEPAPGRGTTIAFTLPAGPQDT